MWKGRENTKAMFGDVFGATCDYSKGTFYSGRREFLYINDSENVLAPPTDFLSKKQINSKLSIEKSGGVNLRQLDFQKKVDPEEIYADDSTFTSKRVDIVRNKQGKTNKEERNKSNMIILEKYSSNRKEDWSEEFQAGCKFYVRKSTGEVSSECPWDVDVIDDDILTKEIDKYSKTKESLHTQDYISDPNPGTNNATGHLVYDSGEMIDFLRMLDSEVEKTKKSNTFLTSTK
jgi:hypothetical protein